VIGKSNTDVTKVGKHYIKQIALSARTNTLLKVK
jgi:hypothetical protein